MEKKNKYVVFIPVRGGSKSIPLKNIKRIGGRPLVCWTVEAASSCPQVDQVFVSTDSEAIRSCLSENMKTFSNPEKIQCIGRSFETATDTATTESAMLEFAQKWEFENIILVQATSPLLEGADLSQAIHIFEQDEYDSLLSVVRQKRFVWELCEDGAKSINYDYNSRPRRQEFDGFFVENGAFYITDREALLQTECRLSGKIGLYEMDEETYFEIDEPSDWKIIEGLLAKKKKTSSIGEIKLVVSDCDGVLTDGGMYYSEHGDEMKRFSTLDGMGFSMLKEKGIKTAIVTGEDTQIVVDRGNKLKIDYLYKGIKDKLPVIKSIAEKEGIALQNIAYIGDDINDRECIEAVGIGFAVANAMDVVKNAADVVLSKCGGSGAVREAVEYILSEKQEEDK